MDPAEARDLVRDELPGYAAGVLIAEPYTLHREYVPADKETHDLLAVTVRRYRDPASGERAAQATAQAPGATDVRTVDAAGLRALSFTQGREQVLVLADGPSVLELRARSTSGNASSLQQTLVETAEILLD